MGRYLTQKEAQELVGTLVACVNEAHLASSEDWKAACWRAADRAEESVVRALMGDPNSKQAKEGKDAFPKPRSQDVPCGECHLQPGEKCDICGAVAPDVPDEGEVR